MGDAFGVVVGELRPHPGGFEADAFSDGHWFVKLWRHEPDSDTSLALTAALAARGIPVPPAQLAVDGSYTAGYLSRRFALFPFVTGVPATWRDAEAIARGMREVHAVTGLVLPRADLNEGCIEDLRARQDHPWIRDRRRELMAAVDRLERVIDRASSIEMRSVVCHRDLFPHNVLVGDDGQVSALLDWGSVRSAPREHDLFVGLCGPAPQRLLRAYGAEGLDLIHLEYARLARSLRDIAARVVDEVDLDGINTWGIEGLRRVDADLALALPFCAG